MGIAVERGVARLRGGDPFLGIKSFRAKEEGPVKRSSQRGLQGKTKAGPQVGGKGTAQEMVNRGKVNLGPRGVLWRRALSLGEVNGAKRGGEPFVKGQIGKKKSGAVDRGVRTKRKVGTGGKKMWHTGKQAYATWSNPRVEVKNFLKKKKGFQKKREKRKKKRHGGVPLQPCN